MLKALLKKLYFSPANPLQWRNSVRLFRILNFEYGYLRSVASNSCLDARGDALPWYTYPAIEFLKQLEFGDKTVFEYGSGNSTLFWGRRAKKVVSVEHNEEWYRKVSARVPGNCELVLETDPGRYANCISQFGAGFDVIVVDGLVPQRTRWECARVAVRHLNEGGVIILDNSDWLPASSSELRGAGLLEVDMTGFGPINKYTWTTSFYFKRNFNFAPRGVRQPTHEIGGLDYNWERGLEEELSAAEAERRAAARAC